MKTLKRFIVFPLATLAVLWLLLTVWVEGAGPSVINELNADTSSGETALVVYDPDPIYDLDEQVCNSFGRGLANMGMKTTVASVRAARNMDLKSFRLIVVCSNTYNWRPDFAITDFIKDNAPWKSKKMVAITLGSGSTAASQEHFEKIIKASQATLLDSRSLWLLRPNDEERMSEPNNEVATTMAYEWALKIAARVQEYRTANEVID